MDVLVCIKRVPLVGGEILLTDDKMEIDARRLGFGLSPHEECAVEAGVRLIEEFGGTVTLMTLGSADAEEQLREQLAIGPDRAILVETAAEFDPQGTAGALVEAIRADGTNFDLIILGSESADTAGYQTGIRIAHALGRPVVTNVKGLKVENGIARCERSVGSIREVYEVPLPAVITVKDGVNIPRYPSVPGRIKARKKPIDRITPTTPVAKLEKTGLSVPPAKSSGAKILGHGPEAAIALVALLREIGVAK
jgi:electron transfer flavoprotein beta subunit